MQNLIAEFLSNKSSGEVALLTIAAGVAFLFLGVKVGQLVAYIVNTL